MVRKISFAVLALAILITGVIAFRKLNYWESSIWIFKLNSGQRIESRTGHSQGDGRGRGGFRDEGRPERAEGIEGQQRHGERFEGSRMRDFPDSNRGRFPSDAGFRSRDGLGRGDFRGGKKINLGSVLWYLAVFASFTVAAIYIDNLLRLLLKNKKTDQCQ
jgi:hypothetical protein